MDYGKVLASLTRASTSGSHTGEQVEGIAETVTSATWTLVYRKLTGLAAVPVESAMEEPAG